LSGALWELWVLNTLSRKQKCNGVSYFMDIQFYFCRYNFLLAAKFLFLYKAGKQANEKFLYLAISQIVSMIMLSLLWILSGYALIWSQAS
jgi:ammonia channel protein AmtB